MYLLADIGRANTHVRYLPEGEREAMQVDEKAPDFTTQDENGKQVSLKQFHGKNVVLFFYPKADTPG
jgi:peroxiredoxin